MKTTFKISKSAVMKRAWSIYKKHRDMFPTFSLSLRRAWEVEKKITDALLEDYYWKNPMSRPESLGEKIARENREKGVAAPIFHRNLSGGWTFL